MSRGACFSLHVLFGHNEDQNGQDNNRSSQFSMGILCPQWRYSLSIHDASSDNHSGRYHYFQHSKEVIFTINVTLNFAHMNYVFEGIVRVSYIAFLALPWTILWYESVSWVQFSSRWYICVRESPYAFHFLKSFSPVLHLKQLQCWSDWRWPCSSF